MLKFYFILFALTICVYSAIPLNWSEENSNDYVQSDTVIFARVVKLEMKDIDDSQMRKVIAHFEICKSLKGKPVAGNTLSLQYAVTSPLFKTTDMEKKHVPTNMIHMSHNLPFDFQMNGVYLLFLKKDKLGFSLTSGPYSIAKLEVEAYDHENRKNTNPTYKQRLILKPNKRGAKWGKALTIKDFFSSKKNMHTVYDNGLEIQENVIVE